MAFAHQARIAGGVERYQGLHARIAHVLQLLVVRAVHVGFVGAKPCRAPAHVEDPLQFRRTRVEARLALERISGVDAAQVFDDQRLVLGFDCQLHVAVLAPPQRPVQAVRAALGHEQVAITEEPLAFDFVAVALVVRTSGREHCLGVAHRDPRPLAAADHEFRVGRGEVVPVEQQAGFGVRRNLEPRGFAGECGGRRHSLRSTHARQPLGCLLHHWNGAGHEHPPVGRIGAVARGNPPSPRAPPPMRYRRSPAAPNPTDRPRRPRVPPVPPRSKPEAARRWACTRDPERTSTFCPNRQFARPAYRPARAGPWRT